MIFVLVKLYNQSMSVAGGGSVGCSMSIPKAFDAAMGSFNKKLASVDTE